MLNGKMIALLRMSTSPRLNRLHWQEFREKVTSGKEPRKGYLLIKWSKKTTTKNNAPEWVLRTCSTFPSVSNYLQSSLEAAADVLTPCSSHTAHPCPSHSKKACNTFFLQTPTRLQTLLLLLELKPPCSPQPLTRLRASLLPLFPGFKGQPSQVGTIPRCFFISLIKLCSQHLFFFSRDFWEAVMIRLWHASNLMF